MLIKRGTTKEGLEPKAEETTIAKIECLRDIVFCCGAERKNERRAPHLSLERDVSAL
jgi:hypothetical protein